MNGKSKKQINGACHAKDEMKKGQRKETLNSGTSKKVLNHTKKRGKKNKN